MNPVKLVRRIFNALLNRLLPIMERFIPPKGLWFGIRFRRYTAHAHGAFQRHFVQRVYDNKEPVVLSGPFAGMRYFDDTFFGPITPRWLGSYEEQLHPIINQVIARAYPIIIDIGSAEGYYSVGLARSLPHSRVYSFDTDPISRRQQKRLKKLNQTNNLITGSFCRWKDFNKLSDARTFAIIDIDSHEFKWLRPEMCDGLIHADLLVEIHAGHDLGHEAFRTEIMNRFKTTHEAMVIHDCKKDIVKYRAICSHALTEDEVAEAVKEYRAVPQSWLWLQAKSS